MNVTSALSLRAMGDNVGGKSLTVGSTECDLR